MLKNKNQTYAVTVLQTITIVVLLISGCVDIPNADDGPPDNPESDGRAVGMVNNDTVAEVPEEVATEEAEPEIQLPKLLDLGADTCRPCRMMEPILEELSEEYKDEFKVEVINVRLNPAVGRQYGIRAIPVQIFFDAGGNELSRHVGFFSKEDILAKWTELGYDF